MAFREEATLKREATPPSANRVVHKSRSGEGLDQLPNYEKLAPFALLTTREVLYLTTMSMAALDRKVASGDFPAPSRLGRNRVWQLGTVKSWISQITQASEEEVAE